MPPLALVWQPPTSCQALTNALHQSFVVGGHRVISPWLAQICLVGLTITFKFIIIIVFNSVVYWYHPWDILRASPSLELLGKQQQSHGFWGSKAATNCYFQYWLTCRPITCFAYKMWLMENARYGFIKTQGDVFKCSEKQQTFTPEMPEQANA